MPCMESLFFAEQRDSRVSPVVEQVCQPESLDDHRLLFLQLLHLLHQVLQEAGQGSGQAGKARLKVQNLCQQSAPGRRWGNS